MGEASRMQGEQYVNSFSQKTWRDEIACKTHAWHAIEDMVTNFVSTKDKKFIE